MKVYVILYKSQGILGKIIGAFIGKYSHAAIFIDKTWCELDGVDEYPKEADYHYCKYMDINQFLYCNPDRDRTVAYRIPKDFSDSECQKGIDFFKKHKLKNTKYGYSKLLRFVYLSKMDWFLKLYYKKKGKPYKPVGDHDGYNVCSEAVAIALKKMGWQLKDLDPKWAYLAPECTHPVHFYKALKNFEYTC